MVRVKISTTVTLEQHKLKKDLHLRWCDLIGHGLKQAAEGNNLETEVAEMQQKLKRAIYKLQEVSGAKYAVEERLAKLEQGAQNGTSPL